MLIKNLREEICSIHVAIDHKINQITKKIINQIIKKIYISDHKKKNYKSDDKKKL